MTDEQAREWTREPKPFVLRDLQRGGSAQQISDRGACSRVPAALSIYRRVALPSDEYAGTTDRALPSGKGRCKCVTAALSEVRRPGDLILS